MEVLDFHAKELKNRDGKKDLYDMISKESIDHLLNLTLNKLKQDAKHTFIDSYPTQGKRFNIVLPYLLNPD
jgi:hypothetical protein